MEMFNIFDTLTNLVDETFEGITAYATSKAKSLASGFLRSYTIAPQNKVTLLNDLFVDRCYSINRDFSSNAPSHNLDNNSVISETVINEPTTFSLKCKFTTADHAEKFKKLLQYRDNTKLISLMYNGKVTNNLAILNINEDVKNVLYTEFTITLRKLVFVTIQTIPAPTTKKVVSKANTTNAGKNATKKVLDTSKPTVSNTTVSRPQGQDPYIVTPEIEKTLGINYLSPYNGFTIKGPKLSRLGG